MAAKQLTFTKFPLSCGVDDPDQNAALWLGEDEDGEVIIKIRLPDAGAWSEPKTPDEAFQIIEREAEATGKVCVFDDDDLSPSTWPTLTDAVKA